MLPAPELTVAFFGHRDIEATEELKSKLYDLLENLILFENARTFLFGSRSKFDYLCLDIVTELKKRYFYIKRIYIRAEYRYISDSYKDYLLELYDDTYYSTNITKPSRAVYIQRNTEMAEKCDIAVCYVTKNTVGAYKALEYAKRKGKRIVNIAQSGAH